jgi:uncharacterized phage protein (TIGR01671 family)
MKTSELIKKQMSRELKFRAWNYQTGNFDYFGLKEGLTKLPLDFIDSEIQQYISLKDKNGKDIYEGDIISFSVNYTVELGDPDIIEYKDCEVYYDEELAGFYFGKNGHQILDKVEVDSIEVTGNIFENKSNGRPQ